MNHLFIIDGSGFIHRAKHVYPQGGNVRADGLDLSCVHGFCQMIWSFLGRPFDGDRPTHIAIAYDGPRHENWRRGISPAYKANRSEPEDWFVKQIPFLRRAAGAFSIKALIAPTFEADDIMASYANAAVRAGWRTTIVTGDKDMLQLMRPDVRIWDTFSNVALTVEDCVKKFGVPPHLCAEVQALMGDAVDNVPGIPGVGPKKAAALIHAYGSAEGVIENALSISQPGLRDKVVLHAESIRMSRELVTLRHDVPLTEPLEELAWMNVDVPVLRAFLRECEFVSIARKIFSQMEMEAGYR